MDTPDSTTFKQCTKCGETKPRDQFHRNKAKKDGLTTWCKPCQIAAEQTKRRAAGILPREYIDPNAEGKICSRCGQYKTRAEFSRAAASRTGMSSRCTDCNRAYARAYAKEHEIEVKNKSRAYRAANRERFRERDREYYASHKDERRVYRAENADRIAEYQRNYYPLYSETHRDQLREYRLSINKTQWRKEQRQAAHHRRRARKRGNGGRCTADELVAIRIAQTDKHGQLICWYCGKPIKGTPHLDHWIPLDKGGPSDSGNLHYMHARCNLEKRAKHPNELGRLI